MTRLIWTLIKLGILVGFGIFFTHYPGSLQIEWLDLRIDTSVALLAAALALMVAIAFYWEKFLGALRRAPGRFRAERRAGARERGYRALTQGFVAVAAGDAQEAIKQSRLAEKLLRDPPLTRLLAAQAAQLSGEDDVARKYFTSMLDDPSGAFLGLRGLMVQAVKAGDRAAALQWAEKAHALRPETPWVILELLDLQTEEEQWDKALATLDTARRRKAMARDEISRRKAAIWVIQARQRRREGLHRSALKLADKARKADPDSQDAIVLDAELLWHEAKGKKAEKLIEDAWAKAPSIKLADVYKTIAGTDRDPIRMYDRAKHLAQRNPQHIESHLMIALAALDASLWGEARQQLSAVEDGVSNPRVCRLMARLEEAEYGDLDAARLWLARAAGEADPQEVDILLPGEDAAMDASDEATVSNTDSKGRTDRTEAT